jgi:drug/metabolite transporter (DMT)-like permease
VKRITTVRFGGLALVFGAIAFMAVFSFLAARTTPAWVSFLGIATAAAGFVGMFRNVTGAVAPVAAINNYLLPLWMIAFGVVLFRHREEA